MADCLALMCLVAADSFFGCTFDFVHYVIMIIINFLG